MKLGFIGLGKMGSNMVKRLLLDNHKVAVWDKNENNIKEAEKAGAFGSSSIKNLVENLKDEKRKIIWLMVPSGKPVDENLDELINLLDKDDIIIDGGNSYYKETMERGIKAAEKGIHYLDCGTSGGVWGLENGYSLMSGGNKDASDYVKPIYETLAPKGGYVYCGQSGSGHFVKMVHNGIEYGMMQAYAEGFELLEKSKFDLNLTEIAGAWRYGSVVRSWLLDLAVNAFQNDPKLENLEDFVQDSGEGRWTINTAIELEVPAHVITASLYNRFQSRQDESFAMKVLAALRNQFGGHEVKTKE
ncbi:MAG: decarboxylating 6-phosphogluconate dehydrogenase [Melioribacteraceae bacterium]|jgi:6-phosphogluconate dehydrogenase|nr:decarboxylating 6-phosphogluconate dehydrogenase [Melioribacteraceae bacterium]